jgi:hypothetical protein
MSITAARRFTLDGTRYDKDADLDHLPADTIAEMRRIGNIEAEPSPPPPDPEVKPSPRRRGAD